MDDVISLALRGVALFGQVPYACTVLVTEYVERKGNKDFIRCEIIVDRESQKGILIGKVGAAIKKLSEESRKEIELFLGKEVYLEVCLKTITAI